MTHLVKMQSDFAERLRRDISPPDSLKAASGLLSHRFDVYRNNVFGGLVSVLETRFPAVMRILGADFFSGFARQFVERHPPLSPALVFYGDAFPGYIRDAEECADVPYLADVAWIEWELHRCYHAADDTILTAEELTRRGLQPSSMTFRLAASAAVVSSEHPSYTIWRVNSRGAASGVLRVAAKPEATLITRCGLHCNAVLLPASGAVFAKSLAAGRTLAAAAHDAMQSDDGFRLDQVLGLMLRQNAFAANSNCIS